MDCFSLFGKGKKNFKLFHPGELSKVRFSKYTNAETLPRALFHVKDHRKNVKQIKILKRHHKFHFLCKLD